MVVYSKQQKCNKTAETELIFHSSVMAVVAFTVTVFPPLGPHSTSTGIEEEPQGAPGHSLLWAPSSHSLYPPSPNI